MDFSNLFKDWSNNYYTIPAMCVIEFVTIIIGLKYSKKNRIRSFFVLYLFIDCCILLTGFYVQIDNSISEETHKAFFRNTNVIIALVEISVYYYYFNKLLLNKHKRFLVALYISYLLCLFIYFSKIISLIASTPIHGSNIIGALEFFLMLPPCFLYFRQLLNTSSKLNLAERPSFWIVTGIFFYSLISIPYYLLMSYFIQLRYEYRSVLSSTFYYIPFSINFLFLLKAFLCKKPLTT